LDKVDALMGEPDGLPWAERVALAAAAARQKWLKSVVVTTSSKMGSKRSPPLAACEANGGDVSDRMCFI